MKQTSALLFFILYLLFSTSARADTVTTSDGKELKGIVVEDYKDRVVLSTADGEKTIMKSNMSQIAFDSEEENLIKLAEQARERRDYTRAYSYYYMASKLNPDSKAAKDGIVFLQGYLFRSEVVKKEDEVKARDDIERYGTVIESVRSEEDKLLEAAENLKKTIGITLAKKDNLPEIVTIQTNSAAYEAGARKGDRIQAIWGRLTGYMPLREVMDGLLDKPSPELKCVIERVVEIPAGPHNVLGLSMEFDGLTVSGVVMDSSAYTAGLNKGDLVILIDGNPTRYMPLNKAQELIGKAKEGPIKLTIRREVLIWRRY